MGKQTKKVRSYRAIFENGAEYQFMSTSCEMATATAEHRALELETKVKELIECAEDDKQAETPQEEHEEPWYGSRIVVIDGKAYVKARFEFDPEVTPRVYEMLRDANVANLTVKRVEPTEEGFGAFEICMNADNAEVLRVAQILKGIKKMADIVYAKIIAEKIGEELFDRLRS